jgi:hypothetical protein
VTKAALCTHCFDIIAPFRDWQTNREWRWCQCDHMGVRWREGARGLIEVTAMHGEQHVRVIGLNNSFLEAAVQMTLTNDEWRMLHDASVDAVEPHYLFHKDRRACWALVVRAGESGDVTFVDWAEAKWPKVEVADSPNAPKE